MRWLTGLGIVLFAWSFVAADQLPPVEDLIEPGRSAESTAVVEIERFVFEGNTVFDDRRLKQVVAEAVPPGRWSGEDFDAARQALTRFYIDQGYINSGAVLPEQTVGDGVVRFRIVEGELTAIDIVDADGLHLRPSYIESRIRHGAGRPLNLVHLKNQLQIMRQGPHFSRINARLEPGDGPGQSRLELDVEEADPLDVALQMNNHRPPSVGAERLNLLVSHRNLLGLGDSFYLNYGIARDLIDEPQFNGDDDIDLAYVLPITPSDTTLALSYTRTNTLLIEEPFGALDITSDSESFAVSLRQPMYRTPNTEFALELTGEHRINQTELSGQPFSFSPGAENGESKVTVIRFAQEWVRRDERHVIALRSVFNFGTPWVDATDHAAMEPDGQYFAWQGQVQYVRRLGDTSGQAIVRLNTQIADDALLSLEQMSIGGVNTVRGYRENQLVRDNAVIVSGELRLPIIQDDSGQPIVQLAPFVDFGHGWNTHAPHSDQHIGSAGLGVLVSLFDRLDGRLYWGVPFRDFDVTDHDLQDAGLHFSVTLRLH